MGMTNKGMTNMGMTNMGMIARLYFMGVVLRYHVGKN